MKTGGLIYPDILLPAFRRAVKCSNLDKVILQSKHKAELRGSGHKTAWSSKGSCGFGDHAVGLKDFGD